MIKKLKKMGWIVLSTLCAFLAVLVVQYLTFVLFDLLLIENHLLFFVLAGVLGWSFRKWYGLIGTSIVSATLLLLMYLDNNLTFELYSVCVIMVCGAATGAFIRRQNWIGSVVASLIGGIVLWNAYQTYSTITVDKVSPAEKTAAIRFNTVCKEVVSLQGDTLQLSRDTVYLVNFTFHFCKPCRIKRPSMELLEKEFVNQPFKLVTIHCVESEAVFAEYYSDYANCYHSSNPKVEQTLGISSFPFEFLFNKSGREVRRFNGFSSDAQADYLKKTRELIKKLIDEKE